MAHDTETKKPRPLSPEEEEKLQKLINHPRLDEVLDQLADSEPSQ